MLFQATEFGGKFDNCWLRNIAGHRPRLNYTKFLNSKRWFPPNTPVLQKETLRWGEIEPFKAIQPGKTTVIHFKDLLNNLSSRIYSKNSTFFSAWDDRYTSLRNVEFRKSLINPSLHGWECDVATRSSAPLDGFLSKPESPPRLTFPTSNCLLAREVMRSLVPSPSPLTVKPALLPLLNLPVSLFCNTSTQGPLSLHLVSNMCGVFVRPRGGGRWYNSTLILLRITAHRSSCDGSALIQASSPPTSC